MLKLFTLFFVLITTSSLYADDEFLPINILQLDPKFNHHVLIVEKSTHKLFLYTNTQGFPELVKSFKIATGKIKGNKLTQGDHKTPEGIYKFQQFHSDDFLVNKYGEYGLIYGAGAFTTNYPNLIDARKGKTGGGIWLHSTDNEERIDKGLDSRGCVVAYDKDLKEIGKYIDLENTSIIIVQNLSFVRKESWLRLKNEVNDLISQWSQSWQKKDFENYINSYSKQSFLSESKGNYHSYKTYKKAVFARDDQPQINFNHISILYFGDYALVTLEQNYSSPYLSDIGKKELYLQMNTNYQWKIVSEQWSKLSNEKKNAVAFTPEDRYFKKKIITTSSNKSEGYQSAAKSL